MKGTEAWAWAQVASTVDKMVDVTRNNPMTTIELAAELIWSQPQDRPEGDRLLMMASVAATALQRLAGLEGSPGDFSPLDISPQQE